MKKYTIKEFAEGKKAVKIENGEQWNKLDKVHKLCTIGGLNTGHYFNNIHEWCDKDWYERNGWEVLEFSQLDFEDEFVVGKWYRITKKGNTIKYIKYLRTQPDGYFWCSEHISNMYGNYGGRFGINDAKDLAEISLEEIQQFLPSNHPDLMKKDTFVLPKYWVLKITPENKAIVNEWKIKQEYNDDLFKYPEYTHVNSDGGGEVSTDFEKENSITFEQFKTHILKEKTMEKEIIGWKLVKPKYKEVIKKITDAENFDFEGFEINGVSSFTHVTKKLKEAGVLDLWFEKVYAPEFKKDDYVTVVSIGTYDYDSSSGDTRPVIGKTYKIYNVSTTYVGLDTPGGIIAIKSSDLRKATEDEVKKAQIQLPTINGYSGKMDGDFIIYGSNCARFHKDFFIDLSSIYNLDGNRYLKSIKLSSDVEISIEEIKQIVECINNK